MAIPGKLKPHFPGREMGLVFNLSYRPHNHKITYSLSAGAFQCQELIGLTAWCIVFMLSIFMSNFYRPSYECISSGTDRGDCNGAKAPEKQPMGADGKLSPLSVKCFCAIWPKKLYSPWICKPGGNGIWLRKKEGSTPGRINPFSLTSLKSFLWRPDTDRPWCICITARDFCVSNKRQGLSNDDFLPPPTPTHLF